MFLCLLALFQPSTPLRKCAKKFFRRRQTPLFLPPLCCCKPIWLVQCNRIKRRRPSSNITTLPSYSATVCANPLRYNTEKRARSEFANFARARKERASLSILKPPSFFSFPFMAKNRSWMCMCRIV